MYRKRTRVCAHVHALFASIDTIRWSIVLQKRYERERELRSQGVEFVCSDGATHMPEPP